MVATGIVDGGIQSFSPITLGYVVTFRRLGKNPMTGKSEMYLNEIRLFETVNLFEEQMGRIKITDDTSNSLEGYGAINLLENLKNRSCGG